MPKKPYNRIQLTLKTDGTMTMGTDEPINFEEFLSATSTATLAFMNDVVKHAPKATQEAVKGRLYDMANVAFSRLLEKFAPEYELRPGLTAQAILEKENEIIERGDLKNLEEGS